MLKDKLMKKLDKKGAKDLDPNEKHAKLSIVKELHRQASGMMGAKVRPAMHDAVDAAPGKHESDPAKEVEQAEEELHADLDHDNEAGESAEHIAKIELPMGEGSPEEEAAESPKEESEEELAAEHADHSPEELDAKIQKLLALKHKKESGRA